MTKKSENKSKITYSTIISTIAFLISVTSFYFTYFRVNHSLKLGVVRARPHKLGIPTELVEDVVLLNQGNKTETLLSAQFVLLSDGGRRRMMDTDSAKGPLVLKSGDAIPIQLNLTVNKSTLDSGADWSGDESERKAEAGMAIEVSAVGPNGNEIIQLIPLGKLTYDEPSDELKPDFQTPEGVNLIELIK